MSTCSACGAGYADAASDCAARFTMLLALDHSRREPWGSRHGLAFSAYALQHPDRHRREVLERGWVMLTAVYHRGHDREAVARGLRRTGAAPPAWDIPPLPAGTPSPPFAITIADLGDFDPTTYAGRLDAWCRATLERWQALTRGS